MPVRVKAELAFIWQVVSGKQGGSVCRAWWVIKSWDHLSSQRLSLLSVMCRAGFWVWSLCSLGKLRVSTSSFEGFRKAYMSCQNDIGQHWHTITLVPSVVCLKRAAEEEWKKIVHTYARHLSCEFPSLIRRLKLIDCFGFPFTSRVNDVYCSTDFTRAMQL